MGARSKAYMEGRLKLLESGQSVLKKGGNAPKKWEAKDESKGYNKGNDFQYDEEDPGIKKKKRTY